MRIQLPPIASSLPEKIDLLKYKKESGIIFLPQDICNTLSHESKRELGAYDRSIKKRHRGDKTPLPLPPGTIRPRNVGINPMKRYKTTLPIADALGELRALDDMEHELQEPGMEPETSSVSHRREKIVNS